MPGRLLLGLWAHAAAFESVEGVVAAMKNAVQMLEPQKQAPLLLGVSARYTPAFCGLTGEEPFEAEEPAATGAMCAGWTRDVCCSNELLSALSPVVAAHASPSCPGCTANLEATVCALACAPELVRPSAKAFAAELSAAYCEAAKAACDQVSPCETAVDILKQFFGPIELRQIGGFGSAEMVPPADACESNTTRELTMGGKRTIPSRHRASVHVMSIWREASAHMLTTLVLVVVGYLLHLMVGFLRIQEAASAKPHLAMLGSQAEVKPRLDVSRL